jgi:hypothetical protein
MQSPLELPDDLVRQLEVVARREGATPAELIERLIEAHLGHPLASGHGDVRFPLIPAGETGPIHPVTGADLDALFGREDFAA